MWVLALLKMAFFCVNMVRTLQTGALSKIGFYFFIYAPGSFHLPIRLPLPHLLPDHGAAAGYGSTPAVEIAME